MKARHNAVCKTILIALSLVPFQPAICGKTHGERAPFAKRAAAAGNEAAHERLDLQITGFDKIVNNYNTDIVYTQGDSVSVVAEATADVLAAVYVNVSDSTLTLGCKQDLQPAVFPGTLTLHVTAPGLYAVTNNCNMTLTADSLAAGNLTIDNRGAANIKLRCTVSGPVSISNYGKQMARQIKYMKRLAPKASILFIGPSDMATKVKANMETYPHLPMVIDSLRHAVLNAGAAYWDLYSVMGGHNSMVQWVNAQPPLAASDYVHFSRGGAERIGDMLCKSLMLYYDYYKWRTDTTQWSDTTKMLNDSILLLREEAAALEETQVEE